MFLGAGALLGFLVIPKISHHIGGFVPPDPAACKASCPLKCSDILIKTALGDFETNRDCYAKCNPSDAFIQQCQDQGFNCKGVCAKSCNGILDLPCTFSKSRCHCG